MRSNEKQRHQIAGRLLAHAIHERLSRTRIGLFANSLPTFDTRSFYETLMQFESADSVRIGLLGFAELPFEVPHVAYSAEVAVAWRNNPKLESKLIIILNPAKAQEKVHSLHMLEPMTDADFYGAICRHAIRQSNGAVARLWEFLKNSANKERLRLVAGQLIALYAELEAGEFPRVALSTLHLLPDDDFEAHLDNLPQRIFNANNELVTWLDELNNSGIRTIARALSRDGSDEISRTFRQIKQYRRQPTAENLAQLTLQRVEAIKSAPKVKPENTHSKNTNLPSASHALIDDMLSLSSRDEAARQAMLDILTQQASRVVERFKEPVEQEYEAEKKRIRNEKQTKQEEDAQERIKRSDLDEEVVYAIPHRQSELHPLHGATREWVHYEAWGGWLTLHDAPDHIQTYRDVLADEKLQPDFTPRSVKKLSSLLSDVDKLLQEEGESIQPIAPLFDNLISSRCELIPHRLIFLYYPLDALLDKEILKALVNYLAAYERFASQLQAVCRHIKAQNPDAADLIGAYFLALDTVIVIINKEQGGTHLGAVLTPLHPLQLWKWRELYRAMYDGNALLSREEINLIKGELQKLPSLLNTFTLNEAMFAEPIQLTTDRLVIVGNLENSKNDNTIGIPYYAKASRSSAEADGLDEFGQYLKHFLAVYPPARLGLSLVVFDPPQLKPILKALSNLYFDEIDEYGEPLLYGATVTILRHDSMEPSEQWTDDDETILQLFRTNPRWQLRIHLEQVAQYRQAMGKLPSPPHIVLVCDPSDTIVVSVDRRMSQQITPFTLPEQVTYDSITDSVKREPFPNDEDLFQLYFGIRHVISGETARTAHAIGKKVNITDLHSLFVTENNPLWLANLDFSQGATQIEQLGHTLLTRQIGQRNLSIYTSEKEWETYWQTKLIEELVAVGLPSGVVATDLMEHIGALYPISEDGLLQLLKSSHSEEYYAQPFDQETLSKLLGLIATLNWYRQQHPGATVISVDETLQTFFGSNPSPVDYLICWLEGDGFHIDLVFMEAKRSDLRGLSHLSTATQRLADAEGLAQTIQELYSRHDNLITPIRQALLHRRLFTSIYAAIALDTTLSHQSRATKRAWADALNKLFTPSMHPTIRLAHIGVALQETIQHIPSVQTVYPADKPFAKVGIRLSAALLHPIPDQVVTNIVNVDSNATTADSAIITDTVTLTDSIHVESTKQFETDISADIQKQADELRSVLVAYGIAISEVNTERTQIGARFIRYWVRLQPPHGRLSDLQKYTSDIARELGTVSIPLIDNIQGEQYVGIDLPRPNPQIVSLATALEKLPVLQPYELMIATGQNVAGELVMHDLARLPHMLVAGHTGGGKSVFLASLITSLVWRHTADTLRFILVDPKLMDFPVFESLPHLHENQVIYDPSEAIGILRWLIEEESIERANKLRASGDRKIESFYHHHPKSDLPRIVVVVDEFADIMNSLPRLERQAFERQINRLAATGRARGIHLVLATQRPTVDVVSGAIKANIPARVSFQLATQTDSRTILDRSGAESLLGKGDMLFLADNVIERLQGYFATDSELERLIKEKC